MKDSASNVTTGAQAAARPRVTIDSALTIEQVALARDLFLDYARSLNVNLCFQGFDEELANLPGAYAAPQGRLLLGHVDGIARGCVALRPLEDGVCEMKRLFVKPEARGSGLGSALAGRIVAEAHAIGYGAMRLDTLPEMQVARGLYVGLGFRPIDNYNANPIPGALFYELDLKVRPAI